MDGDMLQELLDESRDISRRERSNPGEVTSELLRLVKPHKILQFMRIAYRQAERDYMGGLVQATAMRIGRYFDRQGKWHDVTMTAPQVKKLLHAAARDRAGKYKGVFDRDIEDMQAESWSRRLRLYRPLWYKLIPGDSEKPRQTPHRVPLSWQAVGLI